MLAGVEAAEQEDELTAQTAESAAQSMEVEEEGGVFSAPSHWLSLQDPLLHDFRTSRPHRDPQEEALPMVQPSSSGGETVWWILQPRDYACGSTDPGKKS